MSVRALPLLLASATLIVAGCGTSGTPLTRPIEVLYYVSGGTDLEFEFFETGDPYDCGTNTEGIQSPNANHQFGNRVFLTPHLFVLENVRQPVRAAIFNRDTQPIRVDLYFGTNPQQSNVTINPGECRTVSQPGVFPVATPLIGPTPTALAFPPPNARGPEVRVEVCSPQPTPPIGLTTPCVNPTTGDLPPADRNIAYFATIGDIVASNITNCVLPPILDACRSPATFFFENPQDQVDAVFSVNPGQNPGGQPTAEVRAEMYVDGTRIDSSAGVDPVVSADL